jgi:type II secretory pathway pseudopilin PulG
MKIQTTAKRAFTLIEIMVATVIMIVLVGLVIQITSEVLKVWTRSSGKLSANAEARIAMDMITQDLETAVFRNNGQQWLRIEAPIDPGGDYTSQTVALKLFSPALDRDQSSPGDICAIAYRLKFQASYDGGQEKVFALYRYIEDPTTTFNGLMGPSSLNPDIQKVLTGGPADQWDEANVTLEQNYLVSNIVEFKVFIYEDDGSAVSLVPVNGNADGEVARLYAFGGTDATKTNGSQQKLLYADVVLTVVSDEGLELLRLLEEGRAGTGYEDDGADTAEIQVVREHGEVFIRRVNFMAHPL